MKNKKLENLLISLVGQNQRLEQDLDSFDAKAYSKLRRLVFKELRKLEIIEILNLLALSGCISFELTEDERKHSSRGYKGHFSYVSFDIGNVFNEGDFISLSGKTNYTGFCGKSPKWVLEIAAAAKELENSQKKYKKQQRETKKSKNKGS